MGRSENLGPFFTPQEKESLLASFDLSISSNISATGITLAAAATSTSDIAAVYTATSASADAFKLRTGSDTPAYKRTQYVINRSASPLRIFPPSGGTLNGLYETAVTLTSGSHGLFVLLNRTANEYVKL